MKHETETHDLPLFRVLVIIGLMLGITYMVLIMPSCTPHKQSHSRVVKSKYHR
jgi:hypothetical protein